MNLLSGCVSSRVTIPSSELPVQGDYTYVIRNRDSKFFLKDAVISAGIISGKTEGESSHLGNRINLYLTHGSSVSIDAERKLSIPLEEISRVEMVRINKGKTTLIILGSILGIVVLTGSLSFNIKPF